MKRFVCVGACLVAVFSAYGDMPRPYHVLVSVDQGSVRGPQTPFSVEVDFGAVLEAAGVKARLAPGSIAVSRVRDGEAARIAHAQSENLAWVDRGTVSWPIENPADLEYRVDFAAHVEGAAWPLPGYIPVVGNGDCLRYNRPGGEDPMHCHAFSPILADFDNDGKVDVVSRQIYSSGYGEPWFTIWFWRNVGTNGKPVYADYVRLWADGEVIPNHYSGCDLFDWDGDGLLDLVTSKMVYRNTGEKTAAGAPVLTKLADIDVALGKGVTYKHFIGMKDPDLDGVFDAYYQLSKVHYDYEGAPARNFVEGAFYRRVNSAPAGKPPVLGAAEPVERAGAVWTEHSIPTDFCDMDRDGDLDMLGNSRPLDRIPARPQFCYWPNTAAVGQPPVYGRMVLIPNAYNMGGYNIWRVENEAYAGLVHAEGHRARYHAYTGEDLPGQIPGFRDEGVLKQLNGRCGVDGYSSVDVEDWEGDGDWDLIAGDEMGSIWLIRNTGSNGRPVFETPWNIEANGEPIRIMRWHYIQDGNPEYWLGQSKPCYEDWDGDGDRDLVAANNTDRVVFFENAGTREEPVFTRPEVVRIGEDEAPFEKRCRPSVLDWDGDGIADLVSQTKESRLALFRGLMEGGEKGIRPPQLLADVGGAAINVKHPEVCDWDGDGDWDLIHQFGAWGKAGPGFRENVGTNEEPRFKEPVAIRCWGKQITLSAHEHSFSAVDWDGTGRLDLVCGGENGYFFIFRRAALEASAPLEARVTVGKG